jgi:hypothetical protein
MLNIHTEVLLNIWNYLLLIISRRLYVKSALKYSRTFAAFQAFLSYGRNILINMPEHRRPAETAISLDNGLFI